MIYKLIIDPLLAGLRNSIKAQIEPGSTCLDIACGTGDMVFKLMDHCRSLTGVDMDEPKIRSAQKKVSIKGLDHLKFQYADASDLKDFSADLFDYSILSLAVHQFKPELRSLVIKEALRVSKCLIIADYACPMPNSFAGKLASFIEFLAGKEHHSNFKHYQKTGGIPGEMRRVGLPLVDSNAENRVFRVFVVG